MTRYLDLAEYFWLAEQVTGIDATTLATRRCTRPQLVSETTTSTRISSTKPLCSPADWHGIIHSSTGTSEQPGQRS